MLEDSSSESEEEEQKETKVKVKLKDKHSEVGRMWWGTMYCNVLVGGILNYSATISVIEPSAVSLVYVK